MLPATDLLMADFLRRSCDLSLCNANPAACAQVEFILMGGTFMSLPLDYRDYFVRNLHDALSGHASADVGEAVRFSEQSRTKCIGLTIETRPDYCLPPHLTQMLSYGCTRQGADWMSPVRQCLDGTVSAPQQQRSASGVLWCDAVKISWSTGPGSGVVA